MAINDPIQIQKDLLNEKGAGLPEQFVLAAIKISLPGFVSAILDPVWSRLGKDAQLDRARETIQFLLDELKRLEGATATKVDAKELQEAVQLAVRHDAAEFNDKKRARYIKIIGNALLSNERIDDLALFIQDVEQMGERDFTALKVLNRIMNKPGDWQEKSVLHPNTFIQRRVEFTLQMALALAGRRETDQIGTGFSREEGYETCARLQGFGLALGIELSPRQVPIGDYCFRPTKRGLMLLKLSGEEVPNWDKYFSPV